MVLIFQSDAHNKVVEERLFNLMKNFTPEQFFSFKDDTLFGLGKLMHLNWNFREQPPGSINQFDFGSFKAEWATGSINNVDIFKIKNLLAWLKMKRQRHLTLKFSFGELLFNAGSGGMHKTIPIQTEYENNIDDEFNEILDSFGSFQGVITENEINKIVLDIDIPSGWDGRSAFVKMPWEFPWNPFSTDVKGPAALAGVMADRLNDVSIGWSIVKNQSSITITFNYPNEINKASDDEQRAYQSLFNDIEIKLWRNANGR